MPPEGLEPSTVGLKVRCSTRLSYGGVAESRGIEPPRRNGTRLATGFEHQLVTLLGLVTAPGKRGRSRVWRGR